MGFLSSLLLLPLTFIHLNSAVNTPKKNLIIDTDLYSDVDDAGALLLAATSPDVNLLAVNINTKTTFSVLAASAILSHYGHSHVPIGIPRPLTNITFFDGWYFSLGEYASKTAYHFSGGKLKWEDRDRLEELDDLWDPVALYRKVLSEAEDGSVTIASIGFLDNLSGLLNSTGDKYSSLSGPRLLSAKVRELVIMGGGYPTGHSWNFFGSSSSLTAHVINNWDSLVPSVPLFYVGDDVGKYVLTGTPLMTSGPDNDPVKWAYIWYSYYQPRASWDPLAVLYAVHGLGDTFELGNEYGYNHVDPANGTNTWVWEEGRRNQFFLRLKKRNETVAAKVDELFLQGSLSAGRQGAGRGGERLTGQARKKDGGGLLWWAYLSLCTVLGTVIVWFSRWT